MADPTDAQRKALASQGDAMPNGGFPIRNRQDIENAIRAVGRAKGGPAGQAAVRRFIIKRAKALGADDLIPGSWRPDGTLWTMAEDHAWDKAHGIKPMSPQDNKLDHQRGLR